MNLSRRKLLILLSTTSVVGCARQVLPTPTVAGPSPPIVASATAIPIPPDTSPSPGATESAVITTPTPETLPTAQATADASPTSAPPASSVPFPSATAIPPSPTAVVPKPTDVPKATQVSLRVPDIGSHFSAVNRRTPSEVVDYLKGKLSDYPGSTVTSVLNFSPSDILETLDTVVLDRVEANQGKASLQKLYDTIAADALQTLRDTNGDGWILVALDAGHGGNRTFYFDPGSEGTEYRHTRAVVAAMQRLVQAGDYPRIILRLIFDDTVSDDFGLPKGVDRPTVDTILMRQARASMLAREAATWNVAHPDMPVAVHEISIHFNAGAGGAMVLYQGDTVRPEFVSRSLDYGRRYLHRVVSDLNATGLLPAPLRLWGGNGLHDDVMMYRPTYINGLDLPAGAVLRYGALQGEGYFRRYLVKAFGIT